MNSKRQIFDKQINTLLTTEFVSRGLYFDAAELRSASRKAEIVVKRKFAAKVLSQYGYSKSEIGRILNRNHASIIHLLNSKNKSTDIAYIKMGLTREDVQREIKRLEVLVGSLKSFIKVYFNAPS